MADTRTLLTRAVRAALDAAGVDPGFEVVVERSARPEFGDWSTPAPLGLARMLRRAPQAIAAELCAHLEAARVPRVRKWTVTPPGYVNAHLEDVAWAAAVLEDAAALEGGGPVDLPGGAAESGKTLVEHTATNPNKAAHIGHLRNACIGDTVARVLRRTGHAVEVNNYIDDTGVQVADVVVGIRQLGIEQRPDEPFDQYCSRVYVEVSARYETDPDLAQRRHEVLQLVEEGGNDTAVFVKDLARRIVDAHLATMHRFDIAYDLLTWESDIIGLGFWRQAFELLRDSGAIVLAEAGKLAGCWVMPSDDTDDEGGDDDTKVLVKSDGIATYTAKDIAYQLWKFGLLGRDFHYVPWEGEPSLMTTASLPQPGDASAHFGRAQRVINVIDARQAYPQRIVQRALRRLHHEREADSSVHLSYEVVALTPAAAGELGVEIEEGRDSVPLSGRRGIEVRADDLLDRAIARLSANARSPESAQAVAAGAVRYYLLKFSLNQIIAFDFDEALRVTGDTGVYLQYAHARAAGVLRRVDDDGQWIQPPAVLHAAERELLHSIEAYPRALTDTAAALSPSVLTAYAFSLASAFSDFYEHTPAIVREEDAGVRRFRRALVAATRATLADALHTLGMAAPHQV